MKIVKRTRPGWAIWLVLALSGCEDATLRDGQDSEQDTTGTDQSDADDDSQSSAAQDRYVPVGHAVELDARVEADGDGLSYSWALTRQPHGSTAALSNSTASSPTLVPDVAGQYWITLDVYDGESVSQTVSMTLTAADWLLNTSERSGYILDNGQGVLVNVQAVTLYTQDGSGLLTVSATGIPDYAVTLTPDDVDALNARPNADSDFSGGETTARAGDVIEFGESIGYRSSGPGCDLGYWPPGPACPSDQDKSQILPTEPEPADAECSTALDAVGVMLNGTAIYNWADGQSYNHQGDWNNLAPVFEQYDVDICQGHAQMQGDYHHHMYSSCVQDMAEDTGDGHSPIYGFAADGYPIHGPYHLQGVLAKSSWVARDYSAGSASGCGSDGDRSCQLVDQYDLSQGTTNVSTGPFTSDTVTTLSGNSIDAVSGIYFEDYYFDGDLAARGGAYLDEHNGHEHDDYGYHYHITVVDEGGELTPVFPYQIGPTFYGALPDGTFAICGS